MTRQKSKRAREAATSVLLWRREMKVDWSRVPANPEARFRDLERRGLTELRSAGGKARALAHHRKHSEWQEAAAAVWARKPGLSKHEVARIIKKDLGLGPSVKHIARYIRR
jgi:hypothetical protein